MMCPPSTKLPRQTTIAAFKTILAGAEVIVMHKERLRLDKLEKKNKKGKKDT